MTPQDHPKYPKDSTFTLKRHQGQLAFAIYRVHIKLTYINRPHSNPIDDMPWDDGYHNSYIDVKVAGGQPQARYVALQLAYTQYPISHLLEYKAWKAQLIKRRISRRLIKGIY